MRNNNIAKYLYERFGDPIGSYAGDAPVGARDESGICAGCGSPSGQCTCPTSGICQTCGMMPMTGDCGCSCDLDEATEPCDECGMYEVEGSCGCTHLDEIEVEEVAPPGMEKMVKALKKDPDIENPWAVAWSQYNKGKRK